MTQQNAALVEESTAAAQALSDQSVKLAQLMAFFRLDDVGPSNEGQHEGLKKLRNAAAATAVASAGDGWNEF